MMMPEDRTALVRLYEDRFREMGEDIRTLGWKNREEQNLRFKILCDVGDLSGASVCDVGCGFGDLLDYLRSTVGRSEEHTSELQALRHLVCRLLLEKKKYKIL